MPDKLADLLVETGLLQFGSFPNGSEYSPFRFEFDYLPAYPDVLRFIVSEAHRLMRNTRFRRLVVTADAIPFGVALSIETNISLAYSRAKDQKGNYELVGAYNSGDSAILLTSVLNNSQALHPLITQCSRVGLDIQGILTIVDMTELRPDGLPIYRVAHLTDIIKDLHDAKFLPDRQAQASLDWTERKAATLHPNEAAP